MLIVSRQPRVPGAGDGGALYPCHASFEETGCCLAPSMAALAGVLRIIPSPTDRAAIHLSVKRNATLQQCLDMLLQMQPVRFRSLTTTFKCAALTPLQPVVRNGISGTHLTAPATLTSAQCLKIGEMK